MGIAIQFSIYLAFMIAIGYYSMRRTQNNQDFIIGGRSLGPLTSAISAGASDMSSWLLLGLPGAVFAAGLLFCLPAFTIRPFTSPDEYTELKTAGFYGIVRNPIYLGELLWALGWAIMFRSTIGVFLLPLWWAGLLFLVLVEETSLERELGIPYVKYKERVRGRIIPGLPI